MIKMVIKILVLISIIKMTYWVTMSYYLNLSESLSISYMYVIFSPSIIIYLSKKFYFLCNFHIGVYVSQCFSMH